MSDKKKFVILILIFSIVALAALVFLFTADIAVLNPKGMIADKQKKLLLIATVLMLIVVIPVFFMTFAIAWKYRASNRKAKYDPNWDYSLLAEAIWWGVPFMIIAVLGWITWKACHELDPFRPIDTGAKEMTIQVVALDWKWLFIYPEQGIATVNFVQFPQQTPIFFQITADAPMNSFWIPQLGGQVYAMPGMRSELHLIAHGSDQYRGSSANISGTGFSGMTFVAKSSSLEEFDQWVESVRGSTPLDSEEYQQLVKPSEYHPVAYYRLEDEGLFDEIVMKYMGMGHDSKE